MRDQQGLDGRDGRTDGQVALAAAIFARLWILDWNSRVATSCRPPEAPPLTFRFAPAARFARAPCCSMGASASRLAELEAAQAQVRRLTSHFERAPPRSPSRRAS